MKDVDKYNKDADGEGKSNSVQATGQIIYYQIKL